MFLKKLVFASSLLLASGIGAQATPVLTLDFSTPVTLAASETPGSWYVNSITATPNGFSAVGGQLEEVIGPNAALQYQGRSYLMPGGVVEVRVSLFIDPSWATTGREMAYLLGTTANNTDFLSNVPIIGFTSDGAGPRFQGWNVAGGFWYNLGIPIGFVYGEHEIGFRLTGPNSLEYLLDSASIGTTVIANSDRFYDIGLVGRSYPDQPGYTILWDDIIASDASPDGGGGGGGGVADVPEPASLTLLGAGIFGLGMMQKRRIRKTAKLS